MLLKQLITLNEASSTSSEEFSEVDIWQGHNEVELASADVVVEFYYEPASYTDHPYGSGSAREHHPAELSITSITLKHDTDIVDADGDVVGQLEAGSELTTQPWWQDSFYEYFEEKLQEQLSSGGDDDFDEPDPYYD